MASRSVYIGVTAQSPCEYLIKVERDVRIEGSVDSWWRHRRRRSRSRRAAVERIHPFAMPLWMMNVPREKKSDCLRTFDYHTDDDDLGRTRQRSINTMQLFDNTALSLFRLSCLVLFVSPPPSLSIYLARTLVPSFLRTVFFIL